MNSYVISRFQHSIFVGYFKKVTVEYLYYSLRNPKPDVEARIRQLRIIRDLDKKQYSLLKRQLPYVVCGMFNPPYRKTENFAYTEYFIVDIDHFQRKVLIFKRRVNR